MAIIASLLLFLTLDLIGAIAYRRGHGDTPLELAALAVGSASAGLAASLVHLVVIAAFVWRLAPDEEVKGLFRQYMLPGSSMDMVLGVMGVGAFFLTLYAANGYRKAIAGPPPPIPVS